MVPHPKPSPAAFSSIFRRELGLVRPWAFTRNVGSSEALFSSLELCHKFQGHDGPVNTVQFNQGGDLLISSSDDQDVIIWNLADKSQKLAYPSGHRDRVFQAQIMPFTDDRSVITSGADGQVRHGQIADDGRMRTKMVGNLKFRILKLVVEPGNPHIFYSCGSSGIVDQFDLRTPSPVMLFRCTKFNDNNPLRLNTMAIDPRNHNFLAVGGCDQFARLYDIRNHRCGASDQPVTTFSPRHLINLKHIRISGLAYSNTGELLISYNDELIYLFQEGMDIGPNPLSASNNRLQSCSQAKVYSGHRNAMFNKGVCFFGSRDEYVVSGSDCEHIYIWKKQGAKLKAMIPSETVNCVVPHPNAPFLTTCGAEETFKLWGPAGKNQASFPRLARRVRAANRHGRVLRAAMNTSPDIVLNVLRSSPNSSAFIALETRLFNGQIQRSNDEEEGDREGGNSESSDSGSLS